jgi:hypothetical protein
VRAKLAGSANADLRGWVEFADLGSVIEKAPRDSGEYGRARQTLLAAAEGAKDKTLQQEIRGAIDLREKFGAGNVAPDIEGVDLDGVAFKLSDYRGKVVFLDFWGDW